MGFNCFSNLRSRTGIKSKSQKCLFHKAEMLCLEGTLLSFWAIPVNHRTQSVAKFSEIQTFLEGNTGTSAAYIKRGPSCLKGLTWSSLLSLSVKGAPPSYVYSAITGWSRHPSPFPFPNPLPSYLLQQTRWKCYWWLPLATYCICSGILECKFPGPEEKKKRDVLFKAIQHLFQGIKISGKACFKNRSSVLTPRPHSIKAFQTCTKNI